jgi:hypothetical protein
MSTATSRRSAAETKTARGILAAAKQAPPASKAKFLAAKRYADAAVSSQRHESHYSHSSVDQTPIKYFYQTGDSIVGVLGECQAEAYQASSYPLLLDSGRICRVPGNRRLRLAIQKADAIGQRVRITYQGKLYKKAGHYEKCYTIELAPLDKEPPDRPPGDQVTKLVHELASGKAVQA